MARAYEDDLRRKIFEAHAKGHGSFRKLAAVFGVSLGYVEKIFRQRQASGQPERVRYRPGPKSRLTSELSARITALVEAHPDLTVAELRERLALEARWRGHVETKTAPGGGFTVRVRLATARVGATL